MRRIPPYGYAQTGDLIAIKRSGGPVVAFCSVLRVKNMEIDIAAWRGLKQKYSRELCAPASFWRRDRLPMYATLLWIGKVKRIEPMPIRKTDRRSWVALGLGD
jgi:hypothetical protein